MGGNVGKAGDVLGLARRFHEIEIVGRQPLEQRDGVRRRIHPVAVEHDRDIGAEPFAQRRDFALDAVIADRGGDLHCVKP
jgi:hypothetical protein